LLTPQKPPRLLSLICTFQSSFKSTRTPRVQIPKLGFRLFCKVNNCWCKSGPIALCSCNALVGIDTNTMQPGRAFQVVRTHLVWNLSTWRIDRRNATVGRVGCPTDSSIYRRSPLGGLGVLSFLKARLQSCSLASSCSSCFPCSFVSCLYTLTCL
jgi:hypothetical protein